MARVTVEDCIDKVENRFDLVLLASHRARMIAGGAALTVDRRPTVISARNPIELPVEPGSHVVRVARPGAEPFEATASVASDQRQSISLGAPQRATLVPVRLPRPRSKQDNSAPRQSPAMA